MDEIVRRASQVIESAVVSGTTRIRTHVDVDTIGKLRPLEGVAAARARYRDVVDVEIVAFPQEGVVRDPGTAELLRRDPGLAVVGQAATAEQALPVISKLRPDIALVDVELPGMNG